MNLFNEINFETSLASLVVNVCSFTSQPEEDAVVGKEMKAMVVFRNPLNLTLENVKFRFEGLGLQSVREVSYG